MDINIARLEQFAWLLDNDHQPRNRTRLQILWQWADEMAQLQRQVNRTGMPVEYHQRGKVVRTLYPLKEAADASY
jgi:hypothetical protein